jgi:flagellar biosynthesis/type III secretory pathway protein FliH
MSSRIDAAFPDRLPALGGGSRSVLSPDEVSAWQSAEQFHRQAKEQLALAQQELARANEEAQAAAAKGFKEGFDQGFKEGLGAGAAEAKRLEAEAINKVDHYLGSIGPLVAGLARDVVQQVLGNFDAQDLVAAAAARAVAELLPRETGLKVTVHPIAARQVRSVLSGDVAVGANATLEKTGCVVAGDHVVVDAGITPQLNVIWRKIGLV